MKRVSKPGYLPKEENPIYQPFNQMDKVQSKKYRTKNRFLSRRICCKEKGLRKSLGGASEVLRKSIGSNDLNYRCKF